MLSTKPRARKAAPPPLDLRSAEPCSAGLASSFASHAASSSSSPRPSTSSSLGRVAFAPLPTPPPTSPASPSSFKFWRKRASQGAPSSPSASSAADESSSFTPAAAPRPLRQYHREPPATPPHSSASSSSTSSSRSSLASSFSFSPKKAATTPVAVVPLASAPVLSTPSSVRTARPASQHATPRLSSARSGLLFDETYDWPQGGSTTIQEGEGGRRTPTPTQQLQPQRGANNNSPTRLHRQRSISPSPFEDCREMSSSCSPPTTFSPVVSHPSTPPLAFRQQHRPRVASQPTATVFVSTRRTGTSSSSVSSFSCLSSSSSSANEGGETSWGDLSRPTSPTAPAAIRRDGRRMTHGRKKSNSMSNIPSLIEQASFPPQDPRLTARDDSDVVLSYTRRSSSSIQRPHLPHGDHRKSLSTRPPPPKITTAAVLASSAAAQGKRAVTPTYANFALSELAELTAFSSSPSTPLEQSPLLASSPCPPPAPPSFTSLPTVVVVPATPDVVSGEPTNPRDSASWGAAVVVPVPAPDDAPSVTCVDPVVEEEEEAEPQQTTPRVPPPPIDTEIPSGDFRLSFVLRASLDLSLADFSFPPIASARPLSPFVEEPDVTPTPPSCATFGAGPPPSSPPRCPLPQPPSTSRPEVSVASLANSTSSGNGWQHGRNLADEDEGVMDRQLASLILSLNGTAIADEPPLVAYGTLAPSTPPSSSTAGLENSLTPRPGGNRISPADVVSPAASPLISLDGFPSPPQRRPFPSATGIVVSPTSSSSAPALAGLGLGALDSPPSSASSWSSASSSSSSFPAIATPPRAGKTLALVRDHRRPFYLSSSSTTGDLFLRRMPPPMPPPTRALPPPPPSTLLASSEIKENAEKEEKPKGSTGHAKSSSLSSISSVSSTSSVGSSHADSCSSECCSSHDGDDDDDDLAGACVIQAEASTVRWAVGRASGAWELPSSTPEAVARVDGGGLAL